MVCHPSSFQGYLCPNGRSQNKDTFTIWPCIAHTFMVPHDNIIQAQIEPELSWWFQKCALFCVTWGHQSVVKNRLSWRWGPANSFSPKVFSALRMLRSFGLFTQERSFSRSCAHFWQHTPSASVWLPSFLVRLSAIISIQWTIIVRRIVWRSIWRRKIWSISHHAFLQSFLQETKKGMIRHGRAVNGTDGLRNIHSCVSSKLSHRFFSEKHRTTQEKERHRERRRSKTTSSRTSWKGTDQGIHTAPKRFEVFTQQSKCSHQHCLPGLTFACLGHWTNLDLFCGFKLQFGGGLIPQFGVTVTCELWPEILILDAGKSKPALKRRIPLRRQLQWPLFQWAGKRDPEKISHLWNETVGLLEFILQGFSPWRIHVCMHFASAFVHPTSLKSLFVSCFLATTCDITLTCRFLTRFFSGQRTLTRSHLRLFSWKITRMWTFSGKKTFQSALEVGDSQKSALTETIQLHAPFASFFCFETRFSLEFHSVLVTRQFLSVEPALSIC